ncbi:alpha/beta hydrolase [Leifsonia sp. ZF2019]|uniref:alpha/beta fold hydrolase n=1 Tax=Leifsonia sp. ZF2019 TaxID=2781978 RepID=UPI001CC0D21C|nr:alpha/beta hydrolase [Leifsonia sp. ZF2019]UAJ79520.1 alpha/beta hydrolase [Leifsonia sp. ZF2019]
MTPQPTPFVFVHGLFGSFADQAVFDALRPAPCSAPDLIGYGGTAGTVTTEGQVAALRAHIDRVYPPDPVHLVAHSIGGVLAFLYADAHPERVASVTSVEGNFTLDDAFWSRSIATLDENTARATINTRLTDPEGFLTGDGIIPTADLVATARQALSYQPWRTVWESARSVVETTGGQEWQRTLQRVFAATPVHLVAGERSRNAWHVPEWALRDAATFDIVRGAGHMIMLEHPTRFAEALLAIHSP